MEPNSKDHHAQLNPPLRSLGHNIRHRDKLEYRLGKCASVCVCVSWATTDNGSGFFLTPLNATINCKVCKEQT